MKLPLKIPFGGIGINVKSNRTANKRDDIGICNDLGSCYDGEETVR